MKTRLFIKLFFIFLSMIWCTNIRGQLLLKKSFDKTSKTLTIAIKNNTKKEIHLMQSPSGIMTCMEIYLITNSRGIDSKIKERANHFNAYPFAFFSGKELHLKPDSTHSINIDLKKYIDQTRTDIIKLETEGQIVYGAVDENKKRPTIFIKLKLEKEYFNYD